MRQRLSRLFDRLAVVRGEGQQILITRRAIKRHLHAMNPECVGHAQAHAELSVTNRQLFALTGKAFRSLMTT